MNNINYKDLGLQYYLPTLNNMINFTLNRTSKTKDEIWFVEHYPVFTQGKNGKSKNILNIHNNIPIIISDRGGEITYHGPGQAIIYLLIDINRKKISIKKLVEIIEQACINMLNNFYNLKSYTINNMHGIYINNNKIASLGLAIKKGRTYHGIAINSNMDLSPFNYINPCGYNNLKMCQISDFCQKINIKKIQKQYTLEFSKLI